MTDLSKLSPKQRENYHYMTDVMRRLEWDIHNHIEATSRIPAEWFEIARAAHPKETERVTIRLDKDVLRFFRSMGKGYQPRLNDVLRSFVHARLAGVIKGAESIDYFRQRQTGGHDGERPLWGASMRDVGEWEPATDADHKAERLARAREELKRRGLEG